jgi:hypothetical protein
MDGVMNEGIELFCKEARIALEKLLINALWKTLRLLSKHLMMSNRMTRRGFDFHRQELHSRMCWKAVAKLDPRKTSTDQKTGWRGRLEISAQYQ